MSVLFRRINAMRGNIILFFLVVESYSEKRRCVVIDPNAVIR